MRGHKLYSADGQPSRRSNVNTKEGDQGGAGDRPTVGLVLVHQPRGENEKKARCWDHRSSEVLDVDVELQGQPAGGFALVRQLRGEDEKEARAGTNAAAKDTNH